MSEIDYEQKMSNAVKMIEEKGTAFAKAYALAWQMDELKKTVLSDEVNKLDPELSMAERESKARCSEAYKLHLNGTKEAIENKLVLQAQYERWKATFEALRSLCSKDTAQIRMV